MTSTQTQWTYDAGDDRSPGAGYVPPEGWHPSEEDARAAYEVLDHIDRHPESWMQGVFWCGTGGCFAGWRVNLAGETPVDRGDSCYTMRDGKHIALRAAELLGFPSDIALDDYTDQCRERHGIAKWFMADDDDPPSEYLFDGSNSREDLGALVLLIFGPRPDQP